MCSLASDAEEEIRKEELRKEAQKELEEWYVRYKEQIEKAKQANRWVSDCGFVLTYIYI